jgi:outer membrane immunogenic protein
MRKTYALPAAILLALASLPAAAEEFRGFYIGVHGGNSTQTDNPAEFLRTDTDLDGEFDDAVNTPTNPSLFRAFCGGGPNSGRPEAGCRNNFDDEAGDTGYRLGYDWQTMDLVYGVVAEHASGGVTDNTTGFTSDLQTYTFNRKLESISSLRARVGFTFGDGTNLLYGMLGYGWASATHEFTTSNTVNTFTPTTGETDVRGMQFGLGFETYIWKNFTLGLEYLSMNMNQTEDFVVRVAGPAPADDPFLIDNPEGTDMKRSSREIDVSSVRMTFNARFPGW